MLFGPLKFPVEWEECSSHGVVSKALARHTASAQLLQQGVHLVEMLSQLLVYHLADSRAASCLRSGSLP